MQGHLVSFKHLSTLKNVMVYDIFSFPGVDLSREIENVKSLGQSVVFTILCQEVRCFEKLLEVIHRSLDLLVLGLKGEVLMSQGLEEMYDALVANRIPLEWKVSGRREKLTDYARTARVWFLVQNFNFFGFDKSEIMESL